MSSFTKAALRCGYHARVSQARLLRWNCRRRFASAATDDSGRGFTLVQRKAVPELQLNASLYRHDRTGLEHMHIAKPDDDNNVFSIGFATPAVDSTGLPHILEHTTLCGSRKFPVRDPFFKMLNRSLASYMNAFTAIDYTFYPFSTVNATDYKNLRDVYLDATLQPQLKELDFLQEGWRFEHTTPGDVTSPLEFKGVVYNEMKGQMSDANYYFYIAYAREMFRGTVYGNDSGGDPACIPDLSHHTLVEYHRHHYHPSNAKVFTYGSFSPRDTMDALDTALASFERQMDSAQQILRNSQLPTSAGRVVHASGPIDTMTDPAAQVKYSLSYRCAEITDTFEIFALRVLSTLLLDGHGAPLYRALVESQLGSDYSSNTGFDTSTPTSIFTVGLQGLDDASVDRVRSAVQTTLERVAVDGFPSSQVDGVLHQMEIALKRRSASFGMGLLNTVAAPWFKGVGMSDLLVWSDHVDRLRDSMHKGPFLQDLIRKYLTRNGRGADLEFVMRPDSEHESKLAELEKSRLRRAEARLSPATRRDLVTQAARLQEAQQQEQDLACLPTLAVTDIPRQGRYTTLQRDTVTHGAQVLWNEKDSGLTYVRALTELTNVPADLISLLPLYADCLTNLGTSNQSISELEDDIRRHTGGLSCSTFVSTDPNDLLLHKYGLVLSSHCLDRNTARMFDLMTDIWVHTNFENTDKLKTLLRQTAAGVASNVAESGHVFARSAASGVLTPAAALSEELGGLSQAQLLAALGRESDMSRIVSKLRRLHRIVLGSRDRRFLVTSGAANIGTTSDCAGKMHRGAYLEDPHVERTGGLVRTNGPRQIFHTPYAVDYMAHALRGFAYNDPRSAKVQVLAKVLTNKYLHREIREKGGAYGGGATYGALTGVFSYYSYRDPDAAKSLSTVQQAARWLAGETISQRDVDEAKLSIFQSVDAPRSQRSAGVAELTDGITPEMRQKRREALLDVTKEGLADLAQSWLATAEAETETATVILRQKAKPITHETESWQYHDWLMGTTATVAEGELRGERTQAVTDATAEEGTASVASEHTLPNSAPVHVRDQYGQTVTRPVPCADDPDRCLSIRLTDRAIEKLASIIRKQGDADLALRVALESGGCHGYQYALSLTAEIDPEDDTIFSKGGARVAVDRVSLELIDGSKLDYTSELIGTEFKVIDNPRATSSCGCDVSVSIDVGSKPRRSP